MDDLLLNDYEIQKAIDAELDKYYFEDKIPRYSRERCVAQAQLDKIRTAGFIHTVRAERLAKERLAEEFHHLYTKPTLKELFPNWTIDEFNKAQDAIIKDQTVKTLVEEVDGIITHAVRHQLKSTDDYIITPE